MVHLSAERAEKSRAFDSSSFPGPDACREFLRHIEYLSEPLALAPDHVLCCEGDAPRSLFLLTKGDALFTIQSRDGTIPCFAVRAGSLIGLSAIIARTPLALTATVSPEAVVRQMDAQEFLARIEGRADQYMCVLRILAEETIRAHQALADFLPS